MSANAATSSTTDAKQMKTNNSKKANCKLFDLHLSLGSVVIDVSESTVSKDLSTQRENIHISDSAGRNSCCSIRIERFGTYQLDRISN